jgi:Arc/MetJ-type ribon-helix-helix transcriptional regulator
MSKNIIVFRTSDEIIKELERRVKTGIYRNKTEILNEILRTYLGLQDKIHNNSMRVRKR